jgi:hypothetical protein
MKVYGNKENGFTQPWFCALLMVLISAAFFVMAHAIHA